MRSVINLRNLLPNAKFSFSNDIQVKRIVVDKTQFTIQLITTPLSEQQIQEIVAAFSKQLVGWGVSITPDEGQETISPVNVVDVSAEMESKEEANPLLPDEEFEPVFTNPSTDQDDIEKELVAEPEEQALPIEVFDFLEPVVVRNDPNRIRRITADDFDRWGPGKRKNEPPLNSISELSTHDSCNCVVATITHVEEMFYTKRGRVILNFDIYDGVTSTNCKFFTSQSELKRQKVEEVIVVGNRMKLLGEYQFDSFSNYDVFRVYSAEDAPVEKLPTRKDRGLLDRVELHLHTSMSAMDGLIKPDQLFPLLKEWGHEAVAITDHGVVQSYPEIAALAKKHDIKPIFGMEAYIVPDRPRILKNAPEGSKYRTWVVFDLETTGLDHRNDRIIEIGAVKLVDGTIVDRYSAFIDPQRLLPPDIIALTGITDQMLQGQPTIEQVLPAFLEFAEGALLIAHNADFDIAFVRREARALSLPWEFASFDTLALSQVLFPDMRSHRLNRMTKLLGVPLYDHHRAVNDAEATALLLQRLLKSAGVSEEEIDASIDAIPTDRNPGKNRPYHLNLLVQNEVGIRNLYDMVSHSHIETFYMTPRIPESILNQHRDGLLIGSACSDGPVVSAIINAAEENEILQILASLDYVELQPLSNWAHLIQQGLCTDVEDLKQIQREIVRYAKLAGKPVVATSDAHMLKREDVILRDIIKRGKNMVDPKQKLPLYLRTSDEMLEEFEFLGEEYAHEIVIDNTRGIADSIEWIQPVMPGTHAPKIEGSDQTLREMVYDKTYAIYGKPLPRQVEERIERELTSIISNGYAVMYIIAQKLVKKSNDDGYVVGSRGSVGSSLVATMSGITEVNPLMPHYICTTCHHSEFIEDGSYDTGVDLPKKNCPHCEKPMHQDGHDIPFEVFLGFEGDKEPDIDLNFAGEYQTKAHKYVETLFGADKVIRAGTIGTIKDKTAYGYVKKYQEETSNFFHPAEERRLVNGIVEIKRTSSQHPGGIMIVPKERHIHDFTPIQHPADSKDSSVITTHFSYKTISESILKLDILGHDVPTTIRMLHDLTGIDPSTVPMRDRETMEVFSGHPGSDISTIGIPEFGTKFVQDMLSDTHPTTFGELVRISGLSHGTDVWIGNAKELIDQGTAELKDTICTRDDIMRSMILAGLEKKMSFQIMESVRKGRGLRPEMVEAMRAKGVPEWYIESCIKIKYMFPKAHAVAYVLMSYRIAWFKVHHPAAFYASYFTIKIQDVPKAILLGQKETMEALIELNGKKNSFQKLSAKEEAEVVLLEAASEMFRRGITVGSIDLYDSPAMQFGAHKDQILPPLRAVPGISDAMAADLDEERKKFSFTSQDDILYRTKLNKNAMEGLREMGVLDGLSETNQMSFF